MILIVGHISLVASSTLSLSKAF